MKKISMCFIFILLNVSFLLAQFNPPQNFYIVHNYIFPCNYYHLYWDPPEPGIPELVNYNVYRNWEVIATVPSSILTYSEIDAPGYQGTPYSVDSTVTAVSSSSDLGIDEKILPSPTSSQPDSATDTSAADTPLKSEEPTSESTPTPKPGFFTRIINFVKKIFSK